MFRGLDELCGIAPEVVDKSNCGIARLRDVVDETVDDGRAEGGDAA